MSRSKNAIIELHQNSLDNFKGIVVEQKLVGTEVSVLAFCNGNKAYLMPQAQDYKEYMIMIKVQILEEWVLFVQ